MPTIRAYYDDPYTHTFDAIVVAAQPAGDHVHITLDRTHFYPEGGGQPADHGTIAGLPVVDVHSSDTLDVTHIVSQAVNGASAFDLSVGQHVTCQVDWARRFDLMQQHTGQHILSRAFEVRHEAETVGFHLTDTTLTIDLDQPSLNETQLSAAEQLANTIIQANRAVSARIVAGDALDGVRMRRLPAKIATDGLRIVEIEDFDLVACGGTHVARTGEIGLLKIIKVERRGDRLRLEFLCGNRALVDYDSKHQIAVAAAQALTCGLPEVVTQIGKLQESIRTLQRDYRAALDERMQLESTRLIDAAQAARRDVVVAGFDGRGPAELKRLAAALTDAGLVALLAAHDGERTHLLAARPAGSPADMQALLARVFGALEGRGGGRAEMAQGSTPAPLAAALAQLQQEAAAL
jgi:alanyl-tRNA synthetase